MAYEAKILADSLSPAGHRLTTMQLTYPRFVHAEFMTHRVFSRNAASSRAIPVEKMLDRVEQDPVLPVWWGKNQPGMQAKEELPSDPSFNPNHLMVAKPSKEWAKSEWLKSRTRAVMDVEDMYREGDGLHKQIVNRVVEPWMWITVIASATEWDNFFTLRCHKDAQPEIREIALRARTQYHLSEPERLDYDSWHLPLWGFDNDKDLEGETITLPSGVVIPAKVAVSVGRCARVSYLTHDGKRDIQKDIELFRRLAESGHWSPFEHVARPFSQNQVIQIGGLLEYFYLQNLELVSEGEMTHEELQEETKNLENKLWFNGNLRGWNQVRKLFPQESGVSR